MNNWLLDKILIIPAILIGFTFHEFAHAIVADRLGDKTPKFQGRLTLNPIVHTDIIGFIMILIAGFGWAKPVQINPAAFKNGYKDDLKVSIAGPLANLVAAFFGAIIMAIIMKFGYGLLSNNIVFYEILIPICRNIVLINCMLFVFNLIPIPGLDGFHVLRDLFPALYYKNLDRLYRYELIILLVFIATPISTYIVRTPTVFLYNSMMRIVGSFM